MTDIALFHPWIHSRGGVEKIILKLLEKSEHNITLYTSVYKPDQTFEEFQEYEIREITNIPIKGYLLRGISFTLALLTKKIPKQHDKIVISTAGIAEFLNFRNHNRPIIGYSHTPLKAAHDPHTIQQNKERMNLYFAKTIPNSHQNLPNNRKTCLETLQPRTIQLQKHTTKSTPSKTNYQRKNQHKLPRSTSRQPTIKNLRKILPIPIKIRTLQKTRKSHRSIHKISRKQSRHRLQTHTSRSNTRRRRKTKILHKNTKQSPTSRRNRNPDRRTWRRMGKTLQKLLHCNIPINQRRLGNRTHRSNEPRQTSHSTQTRRTHRINPKPRNRNTNRTRQYEPNGTRNGKTCQKRRKSPRNGEKSTSKKPKIHMGKIRRTIRPMRKRNHKSLD